ncbi:ATP-binding protein [Sphaerisporangium sp. NPDC051017]|uniref:ATP-binding protein n=1 Tax=Sphaerisporangium sp. NPDC051017 TaxID=3154636 RepID=UPI00343B8181
MQLPANPESVALARGFVRRKLGADHPVVDEAVLLVSELFSNSVVYSDSRHGGVVMVALADCWEFIHIDVVDAGGSSFPHIKRETTTELESVAEGGRGLSLVDQLSARWGIVNDAEGRTVWFELMYRRADVVNESDAIQATARRAACTVAESLALEEASHPLKPDGQMRWLGRF